MSPGSSPEKRNGPSRKTENGFRLSARPGKWLAAMTVRSAGRLFVASDVAVSRAGSSLVRLARCYVAQPAVHGRIVTTIST